jgi:hypothetical protein
MLSPTWIQNSFGKKARAWLPTTSSFSIGFGRLPGIRGTLMADSRAACRLRRSEI